MGDSMLLALAERCQREEPSRELDEDIARWFAQNDYAWWRDRTGPSNFSQSVDAAATLVPEGKWWSVGCGRLTPDEPLWGALIHEPETDAEISGGETNATAALALCAAALRARAALTHSCLQGSACEGAQRRSHPSPERRAQ